MSYTISSSFRTVRKQIFIWAILLAPFTIARSAFAASGSSCSNTFNNLGDLLTFGTCLINSSVVPLLFAVAIICFLWGVVMYIKSADNEVERKKGQEFIIWGILGLFVMISIWGLVKILGNTFGIQTVIPQLQTH